MLKLQIIKLVRLLSLVIAFLCSSTAYAQSGPWVVSEKSGSVTIGQNGITKLAISGHILNPGDTVKTGKRGRAVLTRGEQYLVVSPNSHIRIAQPKTDGKLTQIIEYFGSVLFKVDKKKDAHFQVKTPYMAAVVKGTSFNVVVSAEGSTVQVTEGAVEVTTLDGTASELLTPGEIGTVQRDNPFNLNIIKDGQTRTIGPKNNAMPSKISAAKASSQKISKTVNVSADLSELTDSLISGRTGGVSSENSNSRNSRAETKSNTIDNVAQQINRAVRNNRKAALSNLVRNPQNSNGNGNNGNGEDGNRGDDDDNDDDNGNGEDGNRGDDDDNDDANDNNGNGDDGNRGDDDDANGNNGNGDDGDDGDDGDANGNGKGNNGNGNGNGGNPDDNGDANGNGKGNNGNGNGNGGNPDDNDDAKDNGKNDKYDRGNRRGRGGRYCNRYWGCRR